MFILYYVILCSRHLVSGNEQEKKSSRIYDKLMYTDSKQSKKRHWEILKLFLFSILNAQISLKLKCFAWVTITSCRSSRQGYKHITSGIDMNFFYSSHTLEAERKYKQKFWSTKLINYSDVFRQDCVTAGESREWFWLYGLTGSGSSNLNLIKPNVKFDAGY